MVIFRKVDLLDLEVEVTEVRTCLRFLATVPMISI